MYRRYRRSFKGKYNIENKSFNLTIPNKLNGATYKNVLVPPDNTAGVRKVTKLRGSFCLTTYCYVAVAIIYLPEGFKPDDQQLFIPPETQTEGTIGSTVNCYMPSQNVLWFGTVSRDSNQTKFSIPISKNLNGGDQIIILARTMSSNSGSTSETYQLQCLYQYAICYR